MHINDGMNHFTRTCPATGLRTLTIGAFWARFHPALAQEAVDRFRKKNKTCDFVEVRETINDIDVITIEAQPKRAE